VTQYVLHSYVNDDGVTIVQLPPDYAGMATMAGLGVGFLIGTLVFALYLKVKGEF
jgi:hypothetical protein